MKKYNKTVRFKFVYFSDYIGKCALACEAAARQNKFKEMHDIIFENVDLLQEDSVYFKFSKEIKLNLNRFNKDINDKMLLKKLCKTKTC